MKHLLKFAVGAAIAGALVSILRNRRSGSSMGDQQELNDNVGEGDTSSTEVVAETYGDRNSPSTPNVLNS